MLGVLPLTSDQYHKYIEWHINNMQNITTSPQQSQLVPEKLFELI